MAALVQTYTKETGTTITMLQTRPTSATSRMPSAQYSASSSQAPRSPYSGNAALTGYRGSSTPIQQYAFKSTPGLHSSSQPDLSSQRGRFPSQSSVTNVSVLGVGQGGSRDDIAIIQTRNGVPGPRPHSAHLTVEASNKAAHDRHRRGNAQPSVHTRSHSATLPSTSAVNLPNTAQFYNIPNSRAALANRPTSFYATIPGSSMDDMHIPQQNQLDVKGMRRRSMASPDLAGSLRLPDLDHFSHQTLQNDLKTFGAVPRPSPHSRNGSSDSVNSSRSNRSRPSVSVFVRMNCPITAFTVVASLTGII